MSARGDVNARRSRDAVSMERRPLAVGSAGSPARPPDRDRDRHDDNDIKNKVETRFLSMWNNMKYAWTVKLKTNFSKESPVWLLGRCYHRKLSPADSPESSTEVGTDATANHPPDQLEGEGKNYFVEC